MQGHFLLVKKLKNTESAQLCRDLLKQLIRFIKINDLAFAPEDSQLSSHFCNNV